MDELLSWLCEPLPLTVAIFAVMALALLADAYFDPSDAGHRYDDHLFF